MNIFNPGLTMQLRSDDLDDLWYSSAFIVTRTGRVTANRLGTECTQCIGVQLVLTDPTRNWVTHPVRNASMRYASAELLWYLSRKASGDMIKYYAPQYENFLDSSGDAYGAYGHRWASLMESGHDQLEQAIASLHRNPHSRQCIVTMWDAKHDLMHALTEGKRDLPCTLSWQFMQHDGELHMICTMRSNDLWLGLPYDVYVNTTIMRMVAETLGLKLGAYIHNVGSLHIYDKHYKRATAAIGRGNMRGTYEPDTLCDYRLDTTLLEHVLEVEESYRQRGDAVSPVRAHILVDSLRCCTQQEPHSPSRRKV